MNDKVSEYINKQKNPPLLCEKMGFLYVLDSWHPHYWVNIRFPNYILNKPNMLFCQEFSEG